MRKQLRIESYEIIERTKVQSLTKVQNLICRLFKIKPHVNFNYTIKAKVNIEYYLRKNDILNVGSGTSWLVSNIIDKNTIEIINFYPTCLDGGVNGNVLVTGTTFCESEK